ncbi:PH domain-containing protein [Aeromicrobium sp.]|uniref:PH domain-containing protein n=1 Tax=Aeromicrobium sp. TaxID=1871063 RepID=UPI002FC58904
MSDSSPAVSEAVGLRTHPLTGVVQGALWAAAAVFGLFTSMFNGDGWQGLNPVLTGLILLIGGLLIGMGVGFLTWMFTRYVIDGTELRINSGIITKSSRRIPYERIQSVDIAEPLVARILGLAELRIEMAGGKNSRTSLRFLKVADAGSLRRVLLDRAHGQTAAEEALDEQRSIITVVPPMRIIIGTLLSLDFLFAALGTVAVLIAALWFDNVIAFIGGIIPLASWLVQIVGQRVIQQWDFTLSRGERGLRIERGLLSRTSQTIPYDRVQGIAIKEPLVWRRLGWQRLEVDVAGYASQGGESEGNNANSTLLPISDAPLANAIIAELLPGADPAIGNRTYASPRSWWFAPIGFRYRWVAANDSTFVASEGWIQRTTSIIPHHKTQSVELSQGPLQRRLGLATVEVHSPKGPVDADGRNLPADAARATMLAQLDRAREARS